MESDPLQEQRERVGRKINAWNEIRVEGRKRHWFDDLSKREVKARMEMQAALKDFEDAAIALGFADGYSDGWQRAGEAFNPREEDGVEPLAETTST